MRLMEDTTMKKKTTASLLGISGFVALVVAIVISVVPEAQAPPPSQPVRVTNTAAEAVPTAAQGITITRNADDPGRLPFYGECAVTLTATFANCSVEVPSGKRLVVEYITAQTLLPVGQRVAQIVVFTPWSVTLEPAVGSVLNFRRPPVIATSLSRASRRAFMPMPEPPGSPSRSSGLPWRGQDLPISRSSDT